MYPYLAVIDIGSNSVRLVIYKHINSHEFHLVEEKKFSVRIGEGAYLNNGHLQPHATTRAFHALKEFTNTIQKYQTIKTLCVATSALRDAPNKLTFINLIKEKLNLDIKVINGNKEAELGALASLHLLPIDNGITIDIGGGSTDIAIIKNSRILDTYSLKLGTVRLKELFSSQKESIDKTISYIKQELKCLPKQFKSYNAISIGGTTRSLTKAIILNKSSNNSIHTFSYFVNEYQTFFEKIILADDFKLKELKIPKNRLDTIREGTLIWQAILNTIEAKKVINSSVGIREGLYLKEINFIDYKQPMKFRKTNS